MQRLEFYDGASVAERFSTALAEEAGHDACSSTERVGWAMATGRRPHARAKLSRVPPLICLLSAAWMIRSQYETGMFFRAFQLETVDTFR